MKPKMTSESKKVQNFPSNLLSPEENQKIFYSLGKQCTTLATTVVQLYLTEEPHHSAWCKKCCGVICFVKDNERRAYFIKLFDMDKSAWIWEQELYTPFVYKPTCTFFHVFEADNCMAGLNFADNDEAMNFKSAVQKKLQMRDERKRERKRVQQNSLQPSNAGINIAAKAKSQSTQSLANGKDTKKDKKKKKKLTKDDISTPTNFMHVQHVGWDPKKGFDIENVDEDLKVFFTLAGVSDKELNDLETRNFIYDFLENHGGVEKAKQEIAEKCTPPPVPTREVPHTPRTPRNTQTRSAAPPPPPPPPSVPPVFQQSSNPVSHRSVRGGAEASPAPPPPPPPPPPPAPLGGCVPPPPPPPPPNVMPEAKPASNPAFTKQQAPPIDNRSALLDQIKKGKELHHVEINGNDAPKEVNDGRGALLNQIRQGVVLKAVSEDSRPAPCAAPMDGLAGALARALQERNRAIHHTDESGSSSDEDDDEWD
ncbi:actin nucleation-promoting factor WASL [Parasteatoda tepidariorum]|uniref:actin nucleation-promoting factor WASL n=1 Tax=Parasteatoda tepidariorum TaxID=114398 RepID=UPI00077FD81E|nr:neural Wiskott-Aldrich syndrome protein [Parasteatoda tepidariorum]XP_015915313.1 neural Wiskott-Aldrich syndrome protein [Parasteatoda tepidariorum]XP_015915314.1 neural Wiskott-Aldrich syndrome protein [Parasteatoda tepidariorum]